MKHLKWIVAIVLAVVVAASAWLVISQHRERPITATPIPTAKSPGSVTLPTEEHVVAAGLTRYLPTGAVAVIHYTGGQALRPAFDQSALGQIFNDPQMQEFLRKPKQALYRGIATATNAPRPELTQQICRWLVGKESAFAVYVEDKPQFVMCVRLGADAPKARALIEEALKGTNSSRKRTYKKNEVAFTAADHQQTIAKDVFVFATCTSAMDAMLERIGADATPAETVTPPALEVGQGIGWAVVDVSQALRKGRTSLTETGAVARFDAVVKELGIERIQRFELATGFDGAGIRTAVRISGLAPSGGLFALYGNRIPLDNAVLKLIPQDVATASAARIDLAALWDTLMRVVELAAGPKDFQQLQDALATFEKDSQVRVKEDLIDAVGDVAVFYNKPGRMPLAGGEVALVLGLKEPQKFSQGVDRLLDYSAKKLAANQSTRPGMPMSIQHSKVGDVDVSYLGGMPMFSPSFAVKGQHAFVAISPVALNAAIAQAEQPRSSLLDNPDYQSARAKLPEKAVAVTYEDTRQLAATAYAMLTVIGPMLAGRGDAPVDLALLPPLAKIQEKLFGGVGVVTVDGGEVVAQQYSAVGLNLTSFAGSTGFMAALALPALNQAREKARSVNCMDHLKQIGLACHLYADQHGDKFPESLDELVSNQLLSSNVLHCPSARSEPEVSYVYCRGLTPKNIYRILAFDIDGNHRNGGRNVLFCDGHVEWMTDAKFRPLLQKQM